MYLNGLKYRTREVLRAFRRDNPEEYIYVFNHIPKCGGTAVRHVLAEWCPQIPDYRGDWDEQATQRFIDNKLDLGRIRRPAIVCGHYGIEGARLHERYPEIFDNPRYRLITFLRDPLEAAISGYYYTQKVAKNASSHDLDVYLRFFESNFGDVLNCTNQGLDQVFKAYWFVGVTEQLNESIRVLSDLMDKPFIAPPVLNVTTRLASPSEEAINVFRRNNRAEFELYEAACERLAHLRASL